MSHTFGESAARIMRRADEESVRLYHGYIGTEHILLGLTLEPGSAGADLSGKCSPDTWDRSARRQRICQGLDAPTILNPAVLGKPAVTPNALTARGTPPRAATEVTQHPGGPALGFPGQEW